jgi:hypothetical protein
MTHAQLIERLKEAFDTYTKRADRLEKLGGSGDEIAEACAIADTYATVLHWVEHFPNPDIYECPKCGTRIAREA